MIIFVDTFVVSFYDIPKAKLGIFKDKLSIFVNKVVKLVLLLGAYIFGGSIYK